MSQWSYMTPVKELFNYQRCCDPQVKNHCPEAGLVRWLRR